MVTSAATRYRFALHDRRNAIITMIAAIVLIVFGLPAIFPVLNIGPFIIIVFLLAIAALAVFLIMLYIQYSYLRAGLSIGNDGVHVQFPLEDPQNMSWQEARFAIDEGEDYLHVSKGREGLGHLVGDTRFIRLHLEGMTPRQREHIKQVLAEHLEVRQPERFTFMTLFDTKGQQIARGRLYLFGDEVLCVENRGKKRVFFRAPLKKLGLVKQVDPFHIGKMECEAFSITYAKHTYVIMLGYETTVSTNLGTSSRWSPTGYAQEWIDALRVSVA